LTAKRADARLSEDGAIPGSRKSGLTTRALLLAALAAFGIFMVYLWQIRDRAFIRYLVANPLIYDQEARSMLDGAPRSQPFFMSPLYPAFVALIYALTDGSRLAVLWVQGALLAANAALLGAAAGWMLSRRIALVAMGATVFYWSFYYFAGEILPTTLFLTFLLAALLLFARRDREGLHRIAIASMGLAMLLVVVYGLPGFKHLAGLVKGRSLAGPAGQYWASLVMPAVIVPASVLLLGFSARRGMRRHANLLASGLTTGISLLVWSGASLVAALLALSLFWEGTRRTARVGIFVAGLAIPLTAATVHNYLISGDFIPMTSSFGVNVFIGNNPASRGMNPFNLGVGDAVRIEADRQGLAGAERSAFFTRQALDYIRTEPVGWMVLVGRKALASVSRFTVDNNADMSERRGAWKRLFLPVLNFGIVFPFGLTGIFYCLRRRRRAYPLVLGFAGSLAVCVIFFVAERFRLPAVACLIPLGAAGLFGLYGDAVSMKWRPLAIGAVIGVAGAVVANIDFLDLRDLEFASITVNKAYVERLAGDLQGARALALEALEKEPENAAAYFQLGAIDEAEGKKAGAMEYYLDSLDRDPFFYASYNRARHLCESAGLSPSYVDGYVRAVLEAKPHDDLRGNLVEYIRERSGETTPP
jgi:hypothetical protein